MKKIIAFIVCLFSGHYKFIREKRKFLYELQANLRSLYFMTNKVEAIVRFYQIIYPLQRTNRLDGLISHLEKRDYGQISALVSSLKNLQKKADEAYGNNEVNLTIPGKKPDKYSIYLSGDVKGFKKMSASYFLRAELELKEQILPPDSDETPVSKKTVWDVVNNQAGTIVLNSSNSLLEELKVIEDWL